MNRFFTVFCSIALLASCTHPENKNTRFGLMENTGINFANKTENTTEFNIFSYRNFYNGAGCAIGDINNDGLADVYFTANMGSNKLYLNKGDFKFEDITDKAGVADADTWSTGVVMVDINHDGWLDIFVCNAGYVKGREPVCNMFINNHDGSFTDQAEALGLTNKGGYTTHAAFFDFDLDGDLDCYILNNSFIPVSTLNYANKRNLRAKDWPVADYLKGGGDKMMRNDNGHFTDISEEANIYGSLIGFGLGVTVGDVNGDRYPDIYVSNDFFERDYLYINQRNGTFKEELESHMEHISHSSMGADMADINNDGQPDVFVTEMLPDDETRLKTTTSFENIDVQRLKQKSGFYNQFMQNTLQVNNGNGKFMETAFYSGVAASDWSWGGLIFDGDNDGNADIFVCNGIYQDVTDQDFIEFFANDIIQKMVMTGKREEVDEIISKMPSRPISNKMFHNNGQLSFTDKAADWGLNKPSFSNGAAYGDLDNDGDLDLIVNNVNQPAFVYRNNTRQKDSSHYIGFKLTGSGENTFAVGSLIKLFTGDKILMRELIPTRGFQSSVDYKMIMGLGKWQPDSVQIIWPNRTIDVLIKPAVDSVYQLRQSSAARPYTMPAPTTSPYYQAVEPNLFDKHQEDDYIDFYYERNIPYLISREGPKIAKADVNGDGLEDVYIGGSVNQPRVLYLQTAKGFVKTEPPAMNAMRGTEDVAVLFFDADRDNDPDLYIGAAGNFDQQGAALQHRLFINDGKGNFTLKKDAFPPNLVNISVAIADDIDGDGDLDLFIGARSKPKLFGESPASAIFINDGKGVFTNQTTSWCPALSAAGMITAAEWADMDGDGKKDLVLAGEWMGPTIFVRKGNSFNAWQTNLADHDGWWQSMAVADLDKDGRNDLLLGNIGMNFYLKPDQADPVKLWMGDFDQNGESEKILTRTVGGKDMPVFMKRELTDQLPGLKKQNLRHEQYATKSIQELFPADVLKKAVVREFNGGASLFARNKGNGQFELEELPYQVQLSSVNAICVLPTDGKIATIVMAGNCFSLQPQFCRLDASFGHLLQYEPGKGFTYISNKQSGIQLTGMVRDIKPLRFKGDNMLLFTQNNDYPVLYNAVNNKPKP